MQRLALLVAVLALGRTLAPIALGAEPARPAPKPGKVGVFPNEKIAVKDQKREYRLVVPKKVDPDKPTALVFAFHGFLIDSKDVMPLYSKLDECAEKHGFILCYPNAVNRTWPLVLDWAKNDLAFFDALCDKLAADYTIDPNRIYVTGMSNGAFFSHVVASQRPKKVAAIAAHSGGMVLVKEDRERRKYPVMLIHGDEDAIVNVRESRKARDTYKQWGHDVVYVEVPKLNHFWATKQGINEKIWKFFEEHPKK